VKQSLYRLLILLLLITGCTEEAKEVPFSLPQYQQWHKLSHKILHYPVPGHGKSLRVIYGNEQAFSPLKSRDTFGRNIYTYRDGTMVVMESYGDATEMKKGVKRLAVMVKDSRSLQAVNGWLYYVVKGDNNPHLITSNMCNGCHEAANEKHPYFDGNVNNSFRDYLFTFSQKKEK
jgi:hypothetical protein